MALLDSKQLNPRLTGSFTLSGSLITDSASTGSFGRLNVTGNSNLVGDLTLGGNITIGDSTGDSIQITADLTSNLTPDSPNTYDIGNSVKTWRYGYINQIVGTTVTTTGNIVTSAGNVSGSSTSTGSFGRVETAGNINASGNVRGSRFEIDGATDYIDTALGNLFIVTTGDIAAQAGTGKALKVTGGISATTNITGSKNIISTGANALISGSSTSTGSFGTLETSGVINATGRIFENGTSVIDHATAMAIVFGG